METINLNRLAYFAAVVEAGSFTRAADRLGITKAVVSQQVARLEAELKTTLLVRSTRRVEPTEAGRRLHARCVQILREADEAFGELAMSNAEPQGVLRVAAPHDYGVHRLAAVAAAFRLRHPGCTVDLVLSDVRVDLLAEHIDVAVRVGWLDDSALQARRVGDFRQLLVARPDVAAAHSGLAPPDLAGAPFIANTGLRDPLKWSFSGKAGEGSDVRFSAGLTSNSTPATLALAIEGAGLAVLPDYLAQEPLREGRLAEVAAGWSLPSGGVHLVYPAARFRPPKVRAFVDMLTKTLKS